jgi:hypothetical protein
MGKEDDTAMIFGDEGKLFTGRQALALFRACVPRICQHPINNEANAIALYLNPTTIDFHLHFLALRYFRSPNPAFTLTSRNRFPFISLPLYSGEAKQR